MAQTYSDAGLLPSATLQPYGQNILKYGIGQLGTPIDVSKLTPQVAGQSAFQQQAAQGIADLGGLGTVQRDASGQVTGFTGGTGVASYQPYLDNISQQNLLDPGQGYQQFMSPYQQQVIDATLTEFDRNQAIQNTGMRDAAIRAGAYGGGREGVMAAESAKGAAMNRAQLQAQLLNQGFQQAQAAAAQDLTARQGLGQYQSALGQQQQAVEQAGLDATQIAAREAEFQPFTQLGLIGQQLAQIQPGAFATQTVGYAPPAAPASPMSQFLGGAAGIAGIGGKLGLFG